MTTQDSLKTLDRQIEIQRSLVEHLKELYPGNPTRVAANEKLSLLLTLKATVEALDHIKRPLLQAGWDEADAVESALTQFQQLMESLK